MDCQNTSQKENTNKNISNIPILNEKKIQLLTNQIKESINQAFFDLISEAISKQPPDIEWIIKLFGEMGDRLCSLTPHRFDLQQEIKDKLNITLFSQMMYNNAFEISDLTTIYHFVFDRIEQLEAPIRNQSTKIMKEKLDKMIQDNKCLFSDFVPIFLRYFHYKLDEIDSDINAFYNNLKKNKSDQPQEKQEKIEEKNL